MLALAKTEVYLFWLFFTVKQIKLLFIVSGQKRGRPPKVAISPQHSDSAHYQHNSPLKTPFRSVSVSDPTTVARASTSVFFVLLGNSITENKQKCKNMKNISDNNLETDSPMPTITPTVSNVVKPVNGLTPLQEIHATLDKRERCSIRVLSQFISWFIFSLRLSVRMNRL